MGDPSQPTTTRTGNASLLSIRLTAYEDLSTTSATRTIWSIRWSRRKEPPEFRYSLAAEGECYPPIVPTPFAPFILLGVIDPVNCLIVPNATIGAEVRLGTNGAEQRNPASLPKPVG